MTTDGPSDGRPLKLRNIAELAALAGVSAGTVSRALAGNPLVNVGTRDRIQAIARTHGFRPNQMAAKLRTQRTGVIGVVVPLGHERGQHISDPFFMTMLGFLADGLTENGYDLMLSRVIPDQNDWLEAIVESGMLDGVLVIGQSNQADAIERVAATYRPIVVWGEHRAGRMQCVVGSDNYGGGAQAAQHLLATGRRKLAFLGDVTPPEIAERYRGANDVALAAGLGDIEVLDAHLASDRMDGELTVHIERLSDGIDGIIAHSDRTAMSMLRTLADHDIAVPDRIAIVGFDDLPLAEQTVPRLTTIRQDIGGGARHMIDALFARIRGADASSVVMPTELVVRDTA